MLESIDAIYKVGGLLAMVLGGFLWIIRAEVSKVRKETSPNHGSSMKDTVNQIHSMSGTLKEMITTLREEQIAWREEQTRHNERLYEGLGKVHTRMDDHIQTHLTKQ